MQQPIYLDYLSTTPVDDEVIASMQVCLGVQGVYGNPASSTHGYGFAAKELVDKARQQVATAVNCDPREIIWTSGATEANNLAIQGVANFYQRQGKHIIVMQTEHKAVLDTVKFLQSQGFSVTFLAPLPNGLLDLTALRNAIQQDTILISIMQVNNETGVIQDINAIGDIAAQHGIKYHVDAAQSIAKVDVDLAQLPVDLMSFSAHKCYGPKGVGALYVRRKPRTRLQALLHGGGHEQGIRSGTIATHQVVGMGAAFEIATRSFAAEHKRITALNQHLWQGLSTLGAVRQHAATAPKIPHCLNLCFDGIDGEALLVSLRGIAVSTGSACNSVSSEPSHVLLAMGLSRVEAQNSLRISLGRYTTTEQIDFAVNHITEQVQRLRAVSPVWERMNKNE